MSFLPTDYKVPESQGQFLKLKQGHTRFRILSSAVIGFLGWTLDNKPVRHSSIDGFKGVALRKREKGGSAEIKHFWAFFAYDLDDKQVKVVEITQKQIMNGIMALIQNTSWGDPKGYNLDILRTGEKLETEYIVSPEPPSELPQEAIDQWAEISKTANLAALFTNGNPFGTDSPSTQVPAASPEEVDLTGVDFGNDK